MHAQILIVVEMFGIVSKLLALESLLSLVLGGLGGFRKVPETERKKNQILRQNCSGRSRVMTSGRSRVVTNKPEKVHNQKSKDY